ncbi:sialidase family protein [Brachyspira sp.]|uniref:sialidase family protein n=1 Tax=Brachyspira sp. TaxID=1977261 RepID=UPI00261EFE90|nr:sialidase family protein [Brachyspira sp.]
MKKNFTKSFALVCALVFAISCSNKGTTGPGGGGKPGSGGGNTVGNGYVLPAGSLSQEEQKQKLDPNKSTKVLFPKGMFESKYFRIPALITTRNGVVLAATDRRYDKTDDLGKRSKIDVIVRRSKDLGNNWEQPITVGPGAKNSDGSDAYGDGFFINCHNGDVILGYIENPGFQNAAKTKLYRSSDEGISWKEVYSFGVDVFQSLGVNVQRGFGASGQGLTLRHGANAGQKRLMFAYLAVAADGIQVLSMISDDDGQNWIAGGKSKIDVNFDETKAFELSSGAVMLNHRYQVSKGGRHWSKADSYNSQSFNFQGTDPDVKDPGNNADLVRYEFDGEAIVKGGEKYALFIHSDAPAKGTWFTARLNHHVKLTPNEFGNGNGNTSGKYIYDKQLVNGGEKLYSGYPAITVLPDGTIGTLTEETPNNAQDQYDIVWRRFNLNWLSDGREYVDYSTGPRFQKPITK